MKYPPRDAYRIRPPFAVKPSPRRLLPLGVLLLGLLLAVAGVLRDLRSTGSEPRGHIPPYSPLPSISSFQPLGNPEATPTPAPASAASPKPTARLLHGSPSPGQALIASPAVQIWSSSDVLQPGLVLAPVDSAADEEVMPDLQASASLSVLSVPSPDDMTSGPAVGDPIISTPTPIPSTPAPTPASQPSPSSKPSPTPQPGPSGGPQTPPTGEGGGKHHGKPSPAAPGPSEGSQQASGG